jgi:cell division septation protein DedD
MVELNLSAATPEYAILKDYLQRNASETLAHKINNGTPFVKDGKTLTNKKTLENFMRYASKEAREKAGKGAQFACVDGDTVINWALHYFEEDSLEGTLYNEDGTEYTPPKPAFKPSNKPVAAAKPRTARKSKTQLSFFEGIGNAANTHVLPLEAVEVRDTEDDKITEPDNDKTDNYAAHSTEIDDNYDADEPDNYDYEPEDYGEYVPEDYNAMPVKTTAVLSQIPVVAPAEPAPLPPVMPPTAQTQTAPVPAPAPTPAPLELRHIGSDKYIDEDGVVYDAPPSPESEAIFGVLQSILGVAVIRR